ncbi:MAG TPA: amidohydrolase family protein [Chloroflexota bacterium]|nr:amidohydrolase family protein [Chloroflexota bacterium]
MNDGKKDREAGAETCDLLIRNAYIITMDSRRATYPKGAMAIEGRTILSVGPEEEITPRYEPLRVIDAGGAAVHPGYIEVHYHAAVHLLGKLLEDSAASSEDAGSWVVERLGNLFSTIGDEEEYASASLAGLDMVRNGYTLFVDPGTTNNPDMVAAACEGLSLRVLVADPWLMDVDAPEFGIFGKSRPDRKRSLASLGSQLWRNKDPDALVRGHVAIYGMGSQSEELMHAAKACADENDVLFTMHQSMCVDDTQSDARRFGRLPYVHWAETGMLGKNCLFVHNNVIEEEELRPIAESGMSLGWVPGNTFYFNTRKTSPNRLAQLYHQGVNIAFGLDVSKTWTFGHNSLLAYQIAREEEQYLFPEDLLAIQTINGAKAVGLDHCLGSLEPGKRADLVIRSNDSPGSHPVCNVERDLMLLSLTRTVDTVIVDGRVVVKNGSHTLIDEQVVTERAQKATESIMERAGIA